MKRLVLATFIMALYLPFAGMVENGNANGDGKPNFSGTWIMDKAQSESANQGKVSDSVTMVIKQTDTAVTIETKRGTETEAISYNLDGSEGKVAGPNGPIVNYRAKMEGSKLITETTRYVNRFPVVTKEVRSLDPTGKEMTEELTVIIQHGYERLENSTTAKNVFKKEMPETSKKDMPQTSLLVEEAK